MRVKAGAARLRSEKAAVAAVYVMTMFMNALDTTIVNVALPTISRQLHVAVSRTGLVSVGYLVSIAVVIPASGWLGDRWGTRRVFVIAVATFTGASALCGFSSSLAELVAFRVLQGVGGGMLVPVATTMLFRAFTPAEQLRAARLTTLPTIVGPASGPILGGLLIAHLSWRWAFFVNLPVGALALVVAAVRLHEFRRPLPGRFDAPGLVLSALGVGLVVYAITSGPSVGWGSPFTLVALGAGVVASGALVAVERRRPEPMLRLDLLGIGRFRSALVHALLSTATFQGLLFLAPIALQVLRGDSALQSGFGTSSEAFGVLLGSQVVSRSFERLGPSRLTLIGFGWLTLVVCTLGFACARVGLPVFAGLMLLMGMSQALVQLTNQAVAYGQVSHDDVGRASSLHNVSRRLGAVLGVACLSSVLGAAGVDGGRDAGTFRDAFLVAAAFALAGFLIEARLRLAGARRRSARA